MNIKFKKVYLHNFMSFRDATIDLSDNGFVLVQGKNENPTDNSQSNGSGKSSIFEAISYCLTGDTIRGTKDIVNHQSDDGTYVGIEMNVDGKEYKLLRSKDHKKYKTNLMIYIDGKDMSGKGIRDSEKLLQQYLPDLTPSLLGSVIVLGQGMPQKFSNNTPAGRKEVLEKLSQSDFMIEDLKNRVAQRKAYLSSEIRKCEDATLKLTSEKETYERQIIATQELLKNLGTPESYDKAVLELEPQLEITEGKIKECNDKVSKLIDEQSDINIKYSNLIAQQNKELNAVDDKYKEQKNILSEQKTDITSKGYALQSEIKRISSIKDVCPTCGQKLPNVVKPDITEQQKELENLKNQLVRVNNNLTEIEEQIKSDKINVALKFKVQENKFKSDLEEHKKEINDLNRIINDLTRNKTQLTNRIATIETEKNQYYIKKSNYEDQIKNLTDSIEKIKNKLLYDNTKDILLEHSKVIDKFDTIIKRDFRGYLLGNVITYINDKAKEYSKYIFDTDKINFELSGNNIEISYDGKEYESLSGGERQKVDIIIQLSLRDMLCKYLNFSANILVADEIFDGLDALGCQRVLDLIMTSLSDISSVYIVSHRDDMPIPYDKELIVVKSKDGISEIQAL